MKSDEKSMKIDEKGGVSDGKGVVKVQVKVQVKVTMGDQNVCGGTRQTLANKPYPDHVIYGELHNQMKRVCKDQTDRRCTLWLEMFGGCVFY